MLKITCVGFLRFLLQWSAFSYCIAERPDKRYCATAERHEAHLISIAGDPKNLDESGEQGASDDDHETQELTFADDEKMTETPLPPLTMQEERHEDRQDLVLVCTFTTQQNTSTCQLLLKAARLETFVFHFHDDTTWLNLQDAIVQHWNLTGAQDWSKLYLQIQSKKGPSTAREFANLISPPIAPFARLGRDLGLWDDETLELKGRLQGGVAHGYGPTAMEWQNNYDFVASISIITQTDPQKAAVCTGTVQSESVLTAAHCVVESNGELRPAWSFNVETADGRVRQVSHVAKHPDYNSHTHENDVAILTLHSKDAYDSRRAVAPTTEEVKPHDRLALAGFGETETGQLGELRIAKMKQMEVQKCDGTHAKSFACLGSGDMSQTSSCGGDSGGPWFRSREDGAAVVVGVTSFGYGGKCGEANKATGIIPTRSVADWLMKFPSFNWDELLKRHWFVVRNYNRQPMRFVTAQAFHPSHGALVAMCTNQAWTTQSSWVAAWKDIKPWIQKKWDEGLSLISLQFAGANRWSAVLTKGVDMPGGGWVTRESLKELKGAIQEAWDAKKRIIDVSYGEGKWALVYGNTTELQRQEWIHDDNWNTIFDWIKQKWQTGLRITSLTRGRPDGQTWFVVMSGNMHFSSQKFSWRTHHDMKQCVDEERSQGNFITTVFDDSAKDKEKPYAVVSSKVAAKSKLFAPTVAEDIPFADTPDCVWDVFHDY